MPARSLQIEDNLPNLELTTLLLGAFGYTPVPATDGTAGLEAARREAPDLIIFGVQLPVRDGLEVDRQIRSGPGLRGTPLVAVTALAMVGDRDRILTAGFDGYVAKPINPEASVWPVGAFLPPRQHAVAPPPPAEVALSPTQPSVRHTVLVVDDLAVNLDLARSTLEPHGYEVVTAAGIGEGLARARERSFNLILSDVCITGATGYEFI